MDCFANARNDESEICVYFIKTWKDNHCVIASEAKQSIILGYQSSGLLRHFVPRNDEVL